ncbi:MAG: PhzF family phenazine biosynthesis protein [Candidatus Auribacterota bacterium]
MEFYITDVFGNEKYSGNQLATFLNCAHISSEEMQKIAREINFSETTFIVSNEPRNGGYDVRIFTPNEEVPFAGHPTLGTAYIIQRYLMPQKTGRVVLNLKAGQIPVTFPADGKDGILWMDQIEPQFKPLDNADLIAPTLGIDPSELDSRYPVEQVSTGLPIIIVPLKSLDVLKRIKLDRDYYFRLITPSWAKAILVFSPQGHTDKHDIGVRMFADYYGVPEDPATGSANGCLAAYLVKHRYFGTASINIRTSQGFEIGRPSELALKGAEESGRISVSVGGRVIPIAKGTWL